MSEALAISAAVILGIPGAILRRAAWPLLASFGFLCFRYYGFGLGYDRIVYATVDAVTFSVITVIIGTASTINWRDIAILALFLPAALVYAFALDPVLSYWILWSIGIGQFILAAPWEYTEQLAGRARGFTWEV